MVQANCRTRFTAADFDFLTRTLARREKDAGSLVKLFTDPEALDSLLDHPALLDAILSQSAHLAISPQLYFYVLTRRVLCADGIEDRRLCDYIAAILEHFSRASAVRGPAGARGTVYLSDVLANLREASPAEAFQLRAYVGNYSLFLTGVFPESVERRSRRGAPDCSFYERVGSASYRALVDHQTAHRWGLNEVYDLLAAQFHAVRLALNRLADRLFTLDGAGELPIVG